MLSSSRDVKTICRGQSHRCSDFLPMMISRCKSHADSDATNEVMYLVTWTVQVRQDAGRSESEEIAE